MKEIKAASVLNRHKKRDPWFHTEYSVNPYQGCSMNCLYCYIRGSKYGVEMDVSAKKNVAEILDRQLARRAKKKEFGFIALASATDPYVSAENDRRLNRTCLEIIARHRFPVFVMTRSDLVFRDLDLLHTIDEQAVLPNDLTSTIHRGVIIASSFCSIDQEIAHRFEPNVASPSQRMTMLAQLKRGGFFTGAHFIPLLPRITDTDEQLTNAIRSAKASNVSYVLGGSITLFGSGAADSKSLILKMVDRFYNNLSDDYRRQFLKRDSTTLHYQRELDIKLKAICNQWSQKYGII